MSTVPDRLSLVLGEDEVKTIIALIPARAGSKRLPGKNIKPLAGHPLIAYTIAAAQQSGIFRDIVVSTDSPKTGDIAKAMGAIYSVRPAEYATDTSPDIEWVRYTLDCDAAHGAEAFSILRPTSPFRTAATIQRAWEKFRDSSYDSIRAVQPVTQHPGKMWVLDVSVYGGRLTPLIGDEHNGVPMHSCPTQVLPQPWIQNASLEMARTRLMDEVPQTIAGVNVGPFFTEGYEGFDLNTLDDWQFAEMKIASGEWTLPPI